MLFKEKKISDTVSTLYATGGLFAKLIYEKTGLEGIKKYLDTPCDQLINKLSELLSVKQEDLYEYAMSELRRETES